MANNAKYWFRFPPGVSESNPRCFCVKDGWPDDAAEAFKKGIFETLSIQDFNAEGVNIPHLGLAALKVQRLELQGLGQISGLEQFINVEIIHEDFIPKNGLNLNFFPHLRSLLCNYEKGMEWIFSFQPFSELSIENFTMLDCQLPGSLVNLKKISFGGGKLRNLHGLEKCEHLTDISLGAIKTLENLDDLKNIKHLSNLNLSELPNLKEFIDLRDIKSIQTLDAFNLRVAVDLSHIGSMVKLTKFILKKVSYIGLDLDTLISMNKLEFICLPVSEEYNVEKLQASAKKHRRTIKYIGTMGTGKSKVAHVTFEKSNGAGYD
ncbi:MAG: hypothetical protein V4495_09420 [Pseudomonadota bacterium]